jgi:hypothetical protein
MEIHELKDFLNEKLDLTNKITAERLDSSNKIIAEKFANISLQLDTIVKQTTKTNGRVNVMEDKMDVYEKFSELHVLQCPVKKDLEDFEKKLDGELFLFKFSKKYPKVTAVVIGILLLFILAGGVKEGMLLLGWLGL